MGASIAERVSVLWLVQYGLAPGSITAAVACMVAAVSRTRRSSVCADQCRASVLEVLPPTGSRGCVVVQDPLAGGGWSAGTFSPRLCACRAERRVMPSHQQHGARPRSRRRPLKGGRVSFGRRRGAVSRHPRRPAVVRRSSTSFQNRHVLAADQSKS